WDLDGVTTTYQWYVGTSKVSGATAGLYRVQAKDLGKDIYVKAAGTKPGYDTGTAASNTIRAVAGDALAVISSPKITGTRAVGHTLTASPGSWAGSSTPTYTYQWLRGGAAITGATKSTYTLSVADAARQVSVRVTAHATAMADGTATSAAVVIAKLGTHTKLALVTAKIRRTAYPKATVTVGDSYGVRPTGTVRVYSGSRLVKSATLRASQNGKVTVTLPKQAVGRHAISARYLGNWQLAASRSTSATLTVVR
ncbi:MAG TPA: Ig-like domain repeat protein, partial [Marmoricola sp.]